MVKSLFSVTLRYIEFIAFYKLVYLKILKHLAILSVTTFASLFFTIVSAQDSLWDSFDTQDATWLWSNNSIVSVNNDLEYYNKNDNSSVVWNYFQGLYYDSIFGYFNTNWSTNKQENVRIISSYSGCPTSYGYKLWWYAYSDYFWFVDFDYNDDIFVYYCDNDQSFWWYAYSTTIGFQNFEWITLDLESTWLTEEELPQWDEDIINDDINITGTLSGSQADNSNYTQNSIQFDTIEFDTDEESTFFIIK